MRMSSLPCFGLCFSEKAPTHHGVPIQPGRTQSWSVSEMTFFVCAKGWISTKSSTLVWFSSYHRTVFEEPFLRNDVTQIYGTVPTWNPTKYGRSDDCMEKCWAICLPRCWLKSFEDSMCFQWDDFGEGAIYDDRWPKRARVCNCFTAIRRLKDGLQ